MRLANDIARWVVNLLLAGGFVWALTRLRERRRAATLVAVACGIDLVERLGTWYAMAYVFGHQVGTPTFRALFGRSVGLFTYLVTAVFVLLLVLAALPTDRRLWGHISGFVRYLRTAGLGGSESRSSDD